MKYILQNKTTRLFKTWVVLVALVAFCGSCTKYQDDAFINFKEPEKAIVGWYAVTNYYINGKDSISAPAYSYLYEKSLIDIRSGNGIISIKNWGYNAYSHENVYAASFVNNKKSLFIQKGATYGVSIFVRNESTWDILKMSNNELWLVAKINGNTYEIHLSNKTER